MLHAIVNCTKTVLPEWLSEDGGQADFSKKATLSLMTTYRMILISAGSNSLDTVQWTVPLATIFGSKTYFDAAFDKLPYLT